jgi:putative FmdB family regulatory protein
MPSYHYRCRSCGVEFNQPQKLSDKPLGRCPVCRTRKVWRIPQLPAIVFKGSGWYCTERRPASGQTGARNEKNGQVEPSNSAVRER